MVVKQIRRLKAQVQDGRRRVMNGRPVEPEDRVPDYIEEDLVDYEDTSGLPPHRRRPCDKLFVRQYLSATNPFHIQ